MKPLFFTLVMSLLFAFSVNDEIELDKYLNGRSTPQFAEYSKNIKATLSKGTTGKVEEVSKPFASGNYGIKISVTNGPKKGQTYWVYYNLKDPALKLFKKASAAEVTTPEEAQRAVIQRKISAYRDQSEHALIETAKKSAVVLETNVTQVFNQTKKVDCAELATATKSNDQCSTCYSPQKALADINAGNLKFMGRDLLPGHDQNRSCVFENEEAYVIYHNCTGNRKEAPAMEIDVLSKKGGRTTYYMETYADGKVSKTPREKYHGTWTVSFAPSAAPEKLNMKTIKDYLSSFENNSAGGCWVGEMGKAQDMSTAAKCYGESASRLSEWGPEAESFWKNPGETWMPTQLKLRKLVETVPF